MSNTTPTSAPTGQNANQRVAPLLAAIDLRDYFAAKAMAALLVNISDSDSNFREIAADAYDMANYMLAAREATP